MSRNKAFLKIYTEIGNLTYKIALVVTLTFLKGHLVLPTG